MHEYRIGDRVVFENDHYKFAGTVTEADTRGVWLKVTDDIKGNWGNKKARVRCEYFHQLRPNQTIRELINARHSTPESTPGSHAAG